MAPRSLVRAQWSPLVSGAPTRIRRRDMKWLDTFLAKRAVGRAETLATTRGLEAALAELSSVKVPMTDALALLAEKLAQKNQLQLGKEVASLAKATAPDHWNARLTLASCHAGLGEANEAAAEYRELNREKASEPLAVILAGQLLAAGQVEEALQVLEPYQHSEQPRTHIAYARACFAGGKLERALEVLDHAVRFYDAERSRGFGSAYDEEEATAVNQLRDELIASLGGEEEVVADHAARRQLDGRAGENFRLLAGKAMVSSKRIAPRLILLRNGELRALGEELMKGGDEVRGLCQLGTAAWRDGSANEALELFEKAAALDRSHFGVQVGTAAARLELQYNVRAHALRLPVVEAPEGVERVIADWDALTDLERRAVLFQVAPFSSRFQELRERGAQLRILPFDVRTMDLPEFEGEKDQRFDDHRSLAALHGLCGDRLAVVSLADVCDTSAERGVTLAHEFAHLVHVGLPPEADEEIHRLHGRACENEWAWAQYQLGNHYEFFACTYVEFLLHENGLDVGRPIDDQETEPTFQFFRQLCPAGTV